MFTISTLVDINNLTIIFFFFVLCLLLISYLSFFFPSLVVYVGDKHLGLKSTSWSRPESQSRRQEIPSFYYFFCFLFPFTASFSHVFFVLPHIPSCSCLNPPCDIVDAVSLTLNHRQPPLGVGFFLHRLCFPDVPVLSSQKPRSGLFNSHR